MVGPKTNKRLDDLEQAANPSIIKVEVIWDESELHPEDPGVTIVEWPDYLTDEDAPYEPNRQAD